jgi:hypothetical protein
MDNFIVVVMKAFRETSPSSKPWYDTMFSWLFGDKPIQPRDMSSQNPVAFFESSLKQHRLEVGENDPSVVAATGGYQQYKTKAENLIERLSNKLSKKKRDLPKKHAKYIRSWEALRLDYKRILNSVEGIPAIQPYFLQLFNVCEAAWSDLNLLALQRMGLTEETATRLEVLKTRVLNLSELKPGISWFRGGDNSRYSIWLKKHNEMVLEIEALNGELNGHAASEQLVVVREALSKIHIEIQYAYNEFMHHSSSERFPEKAIVPHSTAYSPNRSGNLEIPVHEREYSVRARSACEVLGITVSATEKQVRIAYKKKSLIYHPDKFTHEDPSQVIRAKYQLNRIQAAYEFLMEKNGLNDFIRKGRIDLGFLYRDIECQREEWADMRKEMEEYLPARDTYREAQLEEIRRGLTIDRKDFEEIRRDQQLLREDLDRQAIELAKLCAQRDRLMMLVAEKRKSEDINSASTRTLVTPDYSARVSPPPAQANVSKEIDPLTVQHAATPLVAK